MQISSYSSQDLFLTGTPEISFFKVVYRRHTSFSVESYFVDFDNVVKFGGDSVLTVPRIGDLMHKTYLEVIIPEINLTKFNQDDATDSLIAKQQASDDYEAMQKFSSVNRNAFISAQTIFNAENNITNTVNDMIASINSVFDQEGVQTIVDNITQIIENCPDVPFSYSEMSLEQIANSFDTFGDKNDLFANISVGIDKTIKNQKFFFNQLISARKVSDDQLNTNIKFAWVERIGHAIVEEIEIKIGGHKIDKHYGDWLNIWYELSGNRDMEDIYMKMIGNVPELTTFDRNVKPKYSLKIPLQFWFCRHNGLALPLISLEYDKVSFHVKFRNINDVAYIENGNFIKFKQDSLFLDEIPEQLNINISARMMIDYIFLDTLERRRFAQSSHEYLIEQLQVLEKTNIIDQEITCNIDNFVHPSKELIWVVQKNSFVENNDGYTKLKWDNYSLTQDNEINPIQFSELFFNQYERIFKIDGNYFNYVQPYEHHSSTPSDGINMYSFSLFPEESQPSGSANLSKLSSIILKLSINPEMYLDSEFINVRIYTKNINILRFISGFGALAFVYG